MEDDRILVVYKGPVITESKLSKNNKIIENERRIKEFLDVREYVSLFSKIYHFQVVKTKILT